MLIIKVDLNLILFNFQTIARIAAEEELQGLFKDQKLSLEDYLNKYSSQLAIVIDVFIQKTNKKNLKIAPEMQPEIEPEPQPCTSATIDSASPSPVPPSPPIKSVFIQRPSKASKRGPNGNENRSKKFLFCPAVAILSDNEEVDLQNVEKVLLCPLNNVMLRSYHIMQAIEIMKL